MWFHESFQATFSNLISVSGYCMRFIFKICQTVTGISMISQFHEFFNLIFGGFLSLGQTVRNGGGSDWPHGGRGGHDGGQNCESDFCRNEKKWASKEVRTVSSSLNTTAHVFRVQMNPDESNQHGSLSLLTQKLGQWLRWARGKWRSPCLSYIHEPGGNLQRTLNMSFCFYSNWLNVINKCKMWNCQKFCKSYFWVVLLRFCLMTYILSKI